MSGKNSKKIRKAINKKVRVDLEDAIKSICKASFYWRLIYAVRIIIKFHPKPISFETKKT